MVCAIQEPWRGRENMDSEQMTPGEHEWKPRVISSTQEGPTLGEGMRTTSGKAAQDRQSHLVWVETGSQSVEENLGGWVFWGDRSRRESEKERSRLHRYEQRAIYICVGVVTETPEGPAKHMGFRDRQTWVQVSHPSLTKCVFLGKLFGLFKLQLSHL